MLHSLLGTELPILQAPMAGVQASALAIAVSEAGGLGALPAAMLGPDALRAELTAIRAATSRPCNVNFFCHVPAAADDAAWRAALRPYYDELAVSAGPPGPGRAPFDDVMADVLAEFEPQVVSFHFGLPARALLDRLTWRPKVLSSATTVDEARWLEDHGADAIVAQGLEAGGHRGHFLSEGLDGQLGTLALVPRIVDAVRIPVIAAGGIADARGVAAALALGAVAAQVGTAYLLCPEATTSAVHRAALERGGDTVITNVFTGRPARGLVNRLVREVGPMSAVAPPFPLAAAAVAPLRARAEAQGSGDFSPLWCGQNPGCRRIGAAELTRALAQGAGS